MDTDLHKLELCGDLIEMVEDERPTGQLFSLTYVDRGDPTQDSERMRMRLALTLSAWLDIDDEYRSRGFDFSKVIERQLGIEGPHSRYDIGNASYSGAWKEYFEKISATDVLDVVTLALNYQPALKSKNLNAALQEIQRVLDETNVSYEVDSKGGFRPKIDQAFSIQRASVISGLGSDEHQAARDYVDQCIGALREDPPDGARAIRDVFLAAENIFKQMFREADRLDQRSIGKMLRPTFADEPEREHLQVVCAGLTNWVNVAHNYRHATDTTEIIQPSDELRTLLVTQGFSFIRWLASLHNSAQAADEPIAE